MRDAETFDMAEDLERLEAGHDYVGRADGEHGEGDYSGGVGKRGHAEADGIAGIAAPVVRSHFRHGAPAEAGNADAFGRAGGAAGGDQAYQTIGIAASVCPVAIL